MQEGVRWDGLGVPRQRARRQKRSVWLEGCARREEVVVGKRVGVLQFFWRDLPGGQKKYKNK